MGAPRPPYGCERGALGDPARDGALTAAFVVTEVSGPSWDASRPRREQDGWDEHAAFMDALLDDGFVVLGGPIGDGERVMLVVEAEDEEEVRRRLAPDPWLPAGVLEIATIEPWTIWLDARKT